MVKTNNIHKRSVPESANQGLEYARPSKRYEPASAGQLLKRSSWRPSKRTSPVFSKWQTRPNASSETIRPHPPEPLYGRCTRIVRRVLNIRGHLLRAVCGVMRAVRKNNMRPTTSRWRLKGCFCLSSLRATYTVLFITFDSEVEWYCRKSVQDEQCIKVVDYSLVVDVTIDGLPTRLNRALFAAMSGTT